MLRGSLLLLVPKSMTTFVNRGGKTVSLTRHRTCSTRSPPMPGLINPLPKIIFLYVVIITGDTCYNRVSYYYAINVVIVNMENVIVVNFKPVIIINSFRRN